MSDALHRAATAERAARAGGVVARKRFREKIAVETKSDKNDLVTEADRDAQQQVIATITGEFPDATLVCEEETRPVDGASGHEIADDVPESGDAWVIDPIDGTGNYVRGIRFWGTSVAAVTDGEPVGVATYMPALEDSYTAGPESVSRNGEPMCVSDRTDPETFAVGLNGWWPVRGGSGYVPLVESAIEQFGDVRRIGSMQGVLALVAAGSLDAAFMPTTPYPWDSIAGVHLVRRAGGTATDVDGDRWTNGDDGLVVSNGECHDAVLAVARKGRQLEH